MENELKAQYITNAATIKKLLKDEVYGDELDPEDVKRCPYRLNLITICIDGADFSFRWAGRANRTRNEILKRYIK